MARHANAPAGVWDRLWNYAALCENATKPYETGKTKTVHEVRYGRPFDIRKLVLFGCYAVPHAKKDQRRPRQACGSRQAWHLCRLQSLQRILCLPDPQPQDQESREGPVRADQLPQGLLPMEEPERASVAPARDH
eukprot:3476640-Rhodomonas_salina.1